MKCSCQGCHSCCKDLCHEDNRLLPSAVEEQRRKELEKQLATAINEINRLKKVQEDLVNQEAKRYDQEMEALTKALASEPTCGKFMGRDVQACAEIVFIPKDPA